METNTGPSAVYQDYRRIVVAVDRVVFPGPDEIEWGRALVRDLVKPHQSSLATAKAIQAEASGRFAYRIASPRTIAGIVAAKGGNCVSHAIMGLFLLRLAGLPARMCYEFHVRDHSPISGWQAKRRRAGHFGADHNSHFWVMFHDGLEWQPYDSALDYIGFAEFFAVRTRTQRWPYTLSFDPRRMTGAPFIVEQETGTGRTGMINITGQIWEREATWHNQKVSREDWLTFVGRFSGMGTADFVYPLDPRIQSDLLAMARAWF